MTDQSQNKETITQEISNELFDIKEKLTDGEFKSIMDKLSKLNTKKDEGFYKFYFYYPKLRATGDRQYEISIQEGNTILKIDDSDIGYVNRFINGDSNGWLHEGIKYKVYYEHHCLPCGRDEDGDTLNIHQEVDIKVYKIEKM